jgi:translation initiation factor IF-1
MADGPSRQSVNGALAAVLRRIKLRRRLQDALGCARVRGRQRKGQTAAFMSKGDLLEMEGVIQDALGGGQYTIKVDQGGAMVRAQLSGRMRRHHIRVLPGDKVRVAVSPYDLSHGLIVYRGRS